MPARERAPKRLPCAAFFGYFPQRAQESDTSPFANSTINPNLNSKKHRLRRKRRRRCILLPYSAEIM